MRPEPRDKQQQKGRETASAPAPAPEPEPYHDGPPPVGSEWVNQYETRTVVGILPGRGHGYLVRYRVARGWPRRDEGECACPGTDWCRWLKNGGRRAGETTRG